MNRGWRRQEEKKETQNPGDRQGLGKAGQMQVGTINLWDRIERPDSK
jgi:hypothetical protein